MLSNLFSHGAKPHKDRSEEEDAENMQLKCEYYEKAIRLYPDGDVSLHYHYIECLVHLKQFDDAYEHISVHGNRMQNIQRTLLIEIGNYKFDKDEYIEALNMYNRINLSEDELNENEDFIFLNVAFCHQQNNDSAEALTYYYKYYHLHSDDKYCIHNIAVLEYYNKCYFAALQMYKKMSVRYIKEKNLWFNVGTCYHALSEYEKALKYFYKNLKVTSKNRDNCLISIAWIHCKKYQNYDKALRAYKKLSDRVISTKDLEFDVAWTHQQNGEYAEALKWYDLYLRKHKNNVNTLHNVAWIYINAEEDAQYERAKPLLLKILHISPKHFYANYTYGVYLRDIEKNYNLALKCLQIAHGVKAQNIQIVIDIAKTFKYLNNVKSAKEFYQKALQINENSVYAHSEYAHFNAVIEEYKLSDLHYKKVLNLINENDSSDSKEMLKHITNYGHVLFKLDRINEAITVLEQAHILNPRDCNTLNNMGYYHYVLKNYKESEKYLKLCLELNPKHEYTNSTYGNVLFETKQFEKALIYFKIALTLESDTNDMEVSFKLFSNYAAIMFDTNQFGECIRYSTMCVRKFSANDDIDKLYCLIARAYYKQKENDVAYEWISKAFELKPNNEEYRVLCKELEP